MEYPVVIEQETSNTHKSETGKLNFTFKEAYWQNRKLAKNPGMKKLNESFPLDLLVFLTTAVHGTTWFSEFMAFQNKSWLQTLLTMVCCSVRAVEIRLDLWHDNRRFEQHKECQDVTYTAAVKWPFLLSRAPFPLTTLSGMSDEGKERNSSQRMAEFAAFVVFIYAFTHSTVYQSTYGRVFSSFSPSRVVRIVWSSHQGWMVWVMLINVCKWKFATDKTFILGFLWKQMFHEFMPPTDWCELTLFFPHFGRCY